MPRLSDEDKNDNNDCNDLSLIINGDSCSSSLSEKVSEEQIKEEEEFEVKSEENKEAVIHSVRLRDPCVSKKIDYKLKEVFVKLEDIGDKIDELKLSIKSSKNSADLHEVERILDKKISRGATMYFVKWKGWDHGFNTWEPLSNLTNCSKLLSTFENCKMELIESFKEQMNYNPSTHDIESLMKSLMAEGKLNNYSLPDKVELDYNIHTVLNRRNNASQKLLNKVKSDILFYHFDMQRSVQLKQLKDWENEIRAITKNKPVILIENNVDLEGPPSDFLYVDNYLPGKGVTIPDDPPIGCECKSCEPKSNCCGKQFGGTFAYTTARRIRVPLGTPIYECNNRCACDQTCLNRVVQLGATVKLCIFRTETGCGWGVKSLQYIKKGTFVTEYVGEVITNDEAEKRGKEYDAAGRTYLFDLDYNETEQCPYTVDAATYGNISHFINHSCDPNLAVYGVWINCLDPNLPKLGLFATRNIRRSEEITFDYMCQSLRNSAVVTPKKEQLQTQISPVSSPRQRLQLPQENISPINDSVDSRTRCKCGTDKCRRYLF